MHIDTSKLDGTYPAEPECQINSSECSFTPVYALCHECGRKLCEDCAVGVRHQPQIFKYTHDASDGDDRVQYHCSSCAQSHEYNVRNLAAGGAGVVLGLVLLGLLYSVSPIFIIFGLVLAGLGGYILRTEYTLKQKVDSSGV